MNVASKIKNLIGGTHFPTAEHVECVTLTVCRFCTEMKNSVLTRNNHVLTASMKTVVTRLKILPYKPRTSTVYQYALLPWYIFVGRD